MRQLILMIAIMGMLAGCISGRPSSDVYTSPSGKTSVIQSDREQCEHSCNNNYVRCGETGAARSNGGVLGPSETYGAGAECRSDLSSCMIGCKSR